MNVLSTKVQLLFSTFGAFALSFGQALAGDYVFVVDTSGSMRQRVSRQNATSKIATVQSHLRQHLLALPPDSRLTLISFNTGIRSEKEVILRTESDRQAVVAWVDGLEQQTRANAGTHLWAALRRGLTVATEYARQNPRQTVLLRALTDGMDNDPAYRNRSAEQVLSELQRDFPEVDGETIRANLVLLGDLELNVRARAGFLVSRDPNFTVLFPPVIGWEPRQVRVGSQVVFSEKSQRGYRYYDWWIDRQPVSRQPSFTHVFTNAGWYTVRLLVTSADGLREVKTETLEVLEAEKPPPLAPYFTFLPAAPQPGDTVRFVGWASGQGVTLSWRLNGQEVGRGAEVERTFEQEGRFEVTLVATDGAGRSEQTNRSLAVVERPLQVAFSAPSQVRSGQEVQFVNQTQPLDRVVGWRWEFGDGATSGDRSPLHRYVNEGEAERTFQVLLWATNRASKTFASMPQTITVLPAQKPVPAPQAAFRILGNPPFRVGRMLAFQDESTGLVEAFAWDFNGEGTDERKNPEFRFETAGAKTIRLTVRGPGGSHTASQPINIEPRELSAHLVWLNTNGQSIALPARLDYGTANPVHVRHQQLLVAVDDTFEVILPGEGDRPAGSAVTLALEEPLPRVFEVEQRVAESFRPLALPARVSESGRFRLRLRPDAPEGVCTGALTVRTDGPGLLLNGKAEPIAVALHINIASGAPPSVGWLVLLAGAAAAAGWWVLRKRPLTYPVELALEEASPAAAAGGAAANMSCQPAKTFCLERAGVKVDLGQGPDQQHLYDLNAPDWFIMAKDGMLELCNRSGGPSRKLQSGQTVPVPDAQNRPRPLRITFKSVARPKPGGAQTRNIPKRGP